MTKPFFLTRFWLLISLCASYGQNSLRVAVKDSLSKYPLIGAIVQVQGHPTLAASVGATGTADLPSVPDGPKTLLISLVGYQSRSVPVNFPRSNASSVLTIFLSTDTQSLETVRGVGPRDGDCAW